MAISLKDALLDFIAELRAAGVRISVAESLDAMRAIAATGLERTRMREALRAALIKDEGDSAAFDAVFARCFGGARRLSGAPHQSEGNYAGVSGRGGAGSATTPPTSPRPTKPTQDMKPNRAAPAPREIEATNTSRDRATPRNVSLRSFARDMLPTAGSRAAKAAREPAVGTQERKEDAASPSPVPMVASTDAGDTRSDAQLRTVELIPFAQYSDLEYEQARDVLAILRRRLRVRLGRRLHLASSGRIDFRRTIRAAIQRGGLLSDLHFRARRPRHLDLLILADISESVKYASKLMLELAAGAYGCFRRVKAFVYIDQIAEAGFEHGYLVMTPSLDLYARSDFGRVLTQVWERRSELAGRATVVVILGDGRNNRRAPRADLLREIGRRSRAMIWLNPEPIERWNSGDSAIAQYAREVSEVIECSNLRALERSLARLG